VSRRAVAETLSPRAQEPGICTDGARAATPEQSGQARRPARRRCRFARSGATGSEGGGACRKGSCAKARAAPPRRPPGHPNAAAPLRCRRVPSPRAPARAMSGARAHPRPGSARALAELERPPRQRRHARPPGGVFDEVGQQHRQVVQPLAQGGHPDGTHIELVVQVGPEPPALRPRGRTSRSRRCSRAPRCSSRRRKAPGKRVRPAQAGCWGCRAPGDSSRGQPPTLFIACDPRVMDCR
jgi:hypothetical protein